MKLETVVDVQSGLLSAARCYVCNIGFIRSCHAATNPSNVSADDYEGDENGNLIVDQSRLCLPCLVRQELFDTAKRTFPSAFDQNRLLHWPFLKTDPSTTKITKVLNSSFHSISPTDRLQLIESMLNPSSPKKESEDASKPSTRQLSIFEYGRIGGEGGVLAESLSHTEAIAAAAEIEARQSSALDSHLQQKSLSFHSVASTASLLRQRSISPKPAERSSSPSRFARFSPIKGKTTAKNSNSSADQFALMSRGSSLRSFNFASPSPAKANSMKLLPSSSLKLSAADQTPDNEADAGTGLQGGIERGDFALLPLLVAKGHFDHVERSLRPCFSHAEAENGRFEVLPKLQCIQSETYKLMGIWPLALGILMDRADLRAAIYGYEHKGTIQACCQVASCLRKMSCGHLASMYIRSICRKLENKFALLEKSIEHADALLEIAEDLKETDGY